jgi:hypothetical protein
LTSLELNRLDYSGKIKGISAVGFWAVSTSTMSSNVGVYRITVLIKEILKSLKIRTVAYILKINTAVKKVCKTNV